MAALNVSALQLDFSWSPSLWSKLSSVHLYREESRAARVTLVVVAAVAITWAPETALRILSGGGKGEQETGDRG